MTPEERAEKIASQYCNVGLPEIPHIPGKCPLADDIAAEMRAAVEEERELNRREIAVAHKIVDGVKALNDHQLDIAREAYEDAAKIAEPFRVNGAPVGEAIAELIRDRAKEVAK